MQYSPISNSFFPEHRIRKYRDAGTLPRDLIEVTKEEFQIYGLEQPPTGKQRGPGHDGHPTWVDNPAKSNSIRREIQITAIDTAAGMARMRYVSAGQLIEEEYRQAKFAVEAWRAAGSPADAVPSEIISSADYSGITHEEAAVEIEQTAAKWETVLSEIRDLRLRGKAAVMAAGDDAIDSAAQGYIEQLEAMAPAE